MLWKLLLTTMLMFVYIHGRTVQKVQPPHRMPFIPGGLGEEKQPTPAIQALCDTVRDEAEAREGVKYDTFTALSYKKQVVAGINYFIKVDVGTEYCVHLRVFRSFRGDVMLSDVQLNKGMEDAIEYF
ncbi:cystatin-A-like isoform X1 [Branchiostoma floridae x Branchiostoma belcheri]